MATPSGLLESPHDLMLSRQALRPHSRSSLRVAGRDGGCDPGSEPLCSDPGERGIRETQRMMEDDGARDGPSWS